MADNRDLLLGRLRHEEEVNDWVSSGAGIERDRAGGGIGRRDVVAAVEFG